jgi:hypothetical protein
MKGECHICIYDARCFWPLKAWVQISGAKCRQSRRRRTEKTVDPLQVSLAGDQCPK